MTGTQCEFGPAKMLLAMSDYHVRNLRWFLRVAYSGLPTANEWGPKAPGCNTGDWCGELLWEIEQYMIDHKIDPRANVEGDWPLTGWWGGKSTEEYVASGGRPWNPKDRTSFAMTLPKVNL